MADKTIPSSLQRQRDLFEQALDIEDAAERADFLARECGDDRELWQELQALLAAEEDSPTAFMAPPADFAPDPPTPGEQAGDVIGPYTLIDPLGDGAFGVVWRAEQSEPVQREVALKIIKPGMDSSEVVTRFEAERQALALMDHPSIAQVYDAGTTERGRPFVVMELVRGVPITNYCDDNNLSIEARLTLFIEVCRAVQHAHQKGVIHRDLKPSNILVVEHEGKALPKVIDFGIAKAIDQELASRTLATLEGAFLGTPQYMSPEQTGLAGSDIDTRADVYALGAVLYELLTGSPPLTLEELKAGGWGEMERLIREQEPAKPSVRTTTLDAGKTSRHLRGDLDWVVMRALEKDRNRRYDTANGFAQDLERFLANEPVSAGPPTLGYRTRKFVRRNQTLVASLATVAVILLAAVAVSSWQAVIARTAETKALEAEQAEAEKGRALAQQLSEAFVERAAQRIEEGDPGEALLWSLESVRIAREAADPEAGLTPVQRLRGAHAFEEVPHLDWIGFKTNATGFAFAPNGEWLAIKKDDMVQFCDRDTGAVIASHPVNGYGTGVRIDPTGRWMAVRTSTGVFLFDLSSLHRSPALIPATPPWGGDRKVYQNSIAFNFDGSLLAVTQKNGPALIVDPRRDEVIWQIDVQDVETAAKWGPVCTFSPTANHLAIMTMPAEKLVRVQCVDPLTGEDILPASNVKDNGGLLRFDRSGRFLFFYHNQNALRIWDLADGSQRKIVGSGGNVADMLFDDGEMLLLYPNHIARHRLDPPFESPGTVSIPGFRSRFSLRGSSSKELKRFLVWSHEGENSLLQVDVDSGASAFLHRGMLGVRTARYSPDGRTIALADRESVVRVGSSAMGRQPSLVLNRGGGSARYTPDGSMVVGIENQGNNDIAVLWDSATGEPLHKFAPDMKRVLRTVPSPDGRHLATGSTSGQVRIHKLNDPGTVVHTFEFGRHSWNLGFSPDGRYLAAMGAGTADPGRLGVWDVSTGERIFDNIATNSYAHFLFSPASEWGLCKYSDRPDGGNHGLFLHRMADGAKIRIPGLAGKLSNNSGTLNFSRDGRFLVGGQRVFSWEDDEQITETHVLSLTTPYKASFSAMTHDGERVLFTETDGAVRTWNIENGTLSNPPIDSSAGARFLAISPDDRWVATGTRHGEVRIWELATGRLVTGPLRASDQQINFLQFHPTRLQLLVMDWSGRITLWNLDKPAVNAASLEELRPAAEILANRRIAGREVVPLSREELESRWNGMNETVRALVTGKPKEGDQP